MGKRQLLFVTYRDENLEEGVSYAVELAKAMYEDITLLLVQKKSNFMDRIENFMTAVSFAEEGQHEEARRIASGKSAAPGQQEKLLAALQARCSREGVLVSVQETELDVVPGIRTFLKNHAGIDKVVLSPAVTSNGNVSSKDLNRLVRTASRPIVTMTRQAVMA
jgi:hypothetical protein